MPGSAAPEPHRRAAAFVLLVLGVLLLHALIGERLAVLLEAASASRQPPARLEAVFVRELQPAAPPPIPAATPAAKPRTQRPRRAAAPAPVASSPAVEEAASAPEPAPAETLAALPPPELAPRPSEAPSESLPAEPATPVDAAASAPAAVADAASAAPSAASAPAFDWPPSTRLSYRLGGSVRGEVAGTAQVQWVRQGGRYQVHLDVIVGASFAPLMQRRMTSDGAITPEGLAPQRYDEETRIAFGRTRRATVHFDDAAVTLANGRRAERLPRLQDTASQFVQLTYLFLSGGERLQPGGRIEVPLALPRRVDRWVYDVVGEETLQTPFGSVPTWHLRPRRAADPSALSIEAWFAPGLQYLPVRIVIRQDADVYIDLMIERLPQQAEPEPAAR